MITKADLHNHLATTSLMDGLVVPALERAQQTLRGGSAGYGILGLINFEDARYEDFLSKTPRHLARKDFGNAMFYPEYATLVLNGQEIPTQEGHILALGLPHGTHIKSGQRLEDTIHDANLHDGIVVADHPFYKEGIFARLLKEKGGADRIKEVIRLLDGMEVHNGEAALWIPGVCPRNANYKALMHYQKISPEAKENLGMLACSDGHSIKEIGTSYTNLDMPEIEEITCAKDLNAALKSALAKTAERMDFHAEDSKLGALEHMLKLGLIVIGRKFHATNH
jgi:hypothetical protein